MRRISIRYMSSNNKRLMWVDYNSGRQLLEGLFHLFPILFSIFALSQAAHCLEVCVSTSDRTSTCTDYNWCLIFIAFTYHRSQQSATTWYHDSTSQSPSTPCSHPGSRILLNPMTMAGLLWIVRLLVEEKWHSSGRLKRPCLRPAVYAPSCA